MCKFWGLEGVLVYDLIWGCYKRILHSGCFYKRLILKGEIPKLGSPICLDVTCLTFDKGYFTCVMIRGEAERTGYGQKEPSPWCSLSI